MNALSYSILIVGLVLISFFWYIISPKDRKKETVYVSIGFVCLGILVYFLQSTFF
jgi:inner membrane protein involved in colicin E2 resistance